MPMRQMEQLLERLLKSREGVGFLIGVATLAVALSPLPLFGIALVLFSYLVGY